MSDIFEKQRISMLTSFGIELVMTNKVELEKLITSDRLMIEVACLDKLKVSYELLNETYFKHEDHIHDVIEAVVLKRPA